jgi:ligand-binding sensor domain-containing protein/signal transduction histidine kinase
MKTKTHMGKNILRTFLIKGLVILFIALPLLYSSCTNKQEAGSGRSNTENKISGVKKTEAYIPPVSVIITNPTTILLDTCPRPQHITIPTIAANQSIKLKNGELIKLLPPETKPADFFVNMQNYTTDNGLALDAINCGFMDKKRNLWFGTYGAGASRYDGKSFTNFTTAQGLTSNMITVIIEDREGNLWFGTDGGGVSRYDGKSFTNFTQAQGLSNDLVTSIIEDQKGNLWFGTNDGVSRYDGTRTKNPCTLKTCSHNLSIHQDLEKHTKEIAKSFTNFTTAQGLPNKTILSITEDQNGNIWFSTRGGGVSRYNGKSFTNFTTEQGLVNNTIWSSIKDKKGNLWFGAQDGGISRFDGKSFTNFIPEQGIINNNVIKITEDSKGNLWFGTDGGGVLCYDPSASLRTGSKSFTNFTTAQGLANNIVRSITEDQTGSLWFGTDGGGISRYDGKSFINFTTNQGLSNNIIWGILEDKNKNIWFATDGGGLSCYDGNRVEAIERGEKIPQQMGQDIKKINGKLIKSFTNFTDKQGLPFNTVFSLLEDKTGKLWFGTASRGGLSRYDGKSFTTFTTEQGLINNSIRDLLEDKMGNIWIGTSKGISRYDGNRVEAIQRGEKIPLQVQRDLKKVNGKLVKSITNFDMEDGLTDNLIRCITEDKKGNIWFGTDGGGMSRYDGNRVEAMENGEEITERDKQDLKKVNGKFVKSFTNFTTAQGLETNSVLSITEDKTGVIWVGTLGGGLSRYDGKSFMTYTTSDGLPDNVVTQVVVDKHENIIIGTNYGLAILTAFKPKPQGKRELGMKTAQNNLKNEELKNYTPIFEIYNSANGYPIKDINSGKNAMYEDSRGILWIATGSDKTALVRFDYSTLNKSALPPSVFIQSVKINDEKICWNNLLSKTPKERVWNDSTSKAPYITEEVITFGRELNENERDTMRLKFGGLKFDGITPFYPLPEKLELPYEHNNITFDFVAIEPARPFLVRYQYMLQGYDNEWRPITEKTSATFGNIFEGTYTFILKVQSPEGIWSEPIKYSFTVLPPWFRTWWAYVIYAFTTFILLYGIYRWRTASLHKNREILEQTIITRTKELQKSNEQFLAVNKELEAFSYSVSHDLRAPLRAINGYSKILQEDYAPNMDAEGVNFVNAIGNNSKKMGELIDDLLAFSRLGRTEIATSEINMTALVKSVIEEEMIGISNKIEFTVNELLPSNGTQTLIKQVWINLISNAIKFSEHKPKPSIEIGSYYKDHFVVYYVKDNGAGFDMQYYDKLFGVFQRLHSQDEFEGTGIGLAIVQKIILRHNGTVWAESKLNEGACFYFSLPIINS